MFERSITLNGFHYRLIRPLGVPGLVARADLAEVDYAGEQFEVVLKSLASFNQPQMTAQLESEATVLKRLNETETPGWSRLPDAGQRAQQARATLNQRVIIANLDMGVADDGQYYLVQELAPATSVEPFPIVDAAAELKALRLAEKIAQAVSVTHAAGFSLKDFMPQAKIDRLRVEWASDGVHVDHFKVINWNITGDVSEQANDQVFLGSLILALLTGQYAPLNQTSDKWAYATFRPAEFAGEAWRPLSTATHLFIERLLNPLPAQRLAQANSIRQELQWLIDLLQSPAVSPARWGELIEAQRENPSRVLGIIATARSATHDLRDLPPRFQTDLANAEQSAKQKLDLGQQRLLRDVRSDLADQIYSGALERLDEVLPTLDPASEPVRQAYYLKHQALLGQTLNERDLGMPGDHRLARDITQALIDKDWSRARDAWQTLSEDAQSTSAASALNAVIEWRLAAKSIESQIEAGRLPVGASDDSDQPEEARLITLDDIAKKLTAWHVLAPFEFDLKSQLSLLSNEVNSRQRLLAGLQRTRQLLDNGEDEQAVNVCRELQPWGRGDVRLQALACEIEATRQLRNALQPSQQALKSRQLTRARQLAAQVSTQRPADLSEQVWQRVCERVGLTEIMLQAARQPKVPSRPEISQKKKETSQLRVRLNTLPKASGLEVSADEREIYQTSRELAQWAVTARQLHDNGQGKLSARQVQDITEVEGEAEDLRQKLIKRRLKDVTTASGKLTPANASAISTLIGQLREWGPDSAAARQLEQAAKKLTPEPVPQNEVTDILAQPAINGSLAPVDQVSVTLPTTTPVKIAPLESTASQSIERQIADLRQALNLGQYERADEIIAAGPQPAHVSEDIRQTQIAPSAWPALLNEATQRIRLFKRTLTDLAMHEVALRQLSIDDLPNVGLTVSAEEQQCFAQIDSLAHWAAEVLQAHEAKQLQITGHIERVTRLESDSQRVRHTLINRRLSDVDNALNAFGENALAIEGLITTLCSWQPATDLAQRLNVQAERLTALKALRESTQQGLAANALTAAVNAFTQVAASPQVSAVQKTDIQNLVQLWQSFKNNPDERTAMPETWASPQAWPGSETLLKQMRQQVFEHLIRQAELRQAANDLEGAVAFYHKTANYDKLNEAQRAQFNEAQGQLERKRQELANWEATREQVEANLAFLTSPNVDVPRTLQNNWNLLKPYKTPAADGYRTRLRAEFEKFTWSQLPLDPTPDDLERVSRLLNGIRSVTLEPRWGTWAMIINSLRGLLIGQQNWSTFDGYLGQAGREQARNDHNLFDSLARQIADNGQPERLQTLLADYRSDWEKGFEHWWQVAYKEAEAAIQAERPAARSWVDKATVLKEQTGLVPHPPVPSEREMDALGVQAAMLQQREQTIAAANPTQSITAEVLTALEKVRDELGADQLPSAATYRACVERVKLLRLKQLALQAPAGETLYAAQIMTLKTAYNAASQPVAAAAGYWPQRLAAYDQHLAQLDIRLSAALQQAQQAAQQVATDAINTTAAAIQVGTATDTGVQQVANYLWQLGWLAKDARPSAPEAEEAATRARALSNALTAARANLILNCGDRPAYEQTKQKFTQLERWHTCLTTRPDGVPLPDRLKPEATDLDFINLPADWQADFLDQLRLPGISWVALNDKWGQLGQPLKFNSAATAATELVKRVELFDAVLVGLPADGSLPKARAALAQAQAIAAAADKAARLAATDLPGAQAETQKFPAEPLRDADWLWADPRWLDAQMQQAHALIEAEILPKIRAHFKKIYTADENLRRDILPLMTSGDAILVENALLEGARESAADHLQHKRQSDAIKVWSIIETLGKETKSSRLTKEAKTRINQLSGRKRLLLALGGVSMVALALVAFFYSQGQQFAQQSQVEATKSAVALQAQSTQVAATQQAQLIAIQTATASCEQLEFEVLAAPAAQTVPNGKVTLTWRVRNTSIVDACNWDKSGWQLLASSAPRKDPYFVALTKVPGLVDVYDLSIEVDLEPGQYLLEWRLNKPNEIGVLQGDALRAEVLVATPTPVDTLTPTHTPTDTSTPTITPTPTDTPTSTPTITPTPCPQPLVNSTDGCIPPTPTRTPRPTVPPTQTNTPVPTIPTCPPGKVWNAPMNRCDNGGDNGGGPTPVGPR